MHIKTAVLFAVPLFVVAISGCSKSQSVEVLTSTAPPTITVEAGTIHVQLIYKAKREGTLILQVDDTEYDRVRAEPSDEPGTSVTLTAKGLSSGQHSLQVLLQLGDAEPIVRSSGVALVP